MLSNSKGQDLVLHSIAVGMLAVKIFENNYQGLWKDVIESNSESTNNANYTLENYKKVLFNAGVYHDVGKLDRNFQNYLEKNMSKASDYDVQIEDIKIIDIQKYPLHHEISWAILNLQDNNLRSYHKELFLYSIYWHHAKLIRKYEDSKDLTELKNIINVENLNLDLLSSDFIDFNKKVLDILEKTSSSQKLAINTYIDLQELKDRINQRIITPLFQSTIFEKGVSEKICFLRKSLNHLTRAILISADRYISKLSKEELAELFETTDLDNSLVINKIAKNAINNEEFDLSESIDSMKQEFFKKSNELEGKKLEDAKNRNKSQEDTVINLANKGKIAILQGPAGVGKTKMMLEWLGKINNKKKTYIIAPKTNIVNELYNELIKNYLPHTQIEKITGAEKIRKINGEEVIIEDNDYFKSPVNVTTIDQLMSLMMSHDKIDIYLDVLNSNLIFDEFHEFMDTPALLMLFIQTIILKKMSNEGRCLLVSATPNPFLIEKLNLSIENDLVIIPTFNKTKYKINNISFFDSEKSVDVMNEMFEPKKAGMICIFNTATASQTSSIKASRDGEKNTITYHSKFYPTDRAEIFSKLMEEFGKSKGTNNKTDYILRSGPILQASIDISTTHMQTEISTIDNIYQRLGRVVRWGGLENGIYDIIIPENYSKRNVSITRSLNNNGQYEIVEQFIKYFEDNVFNKDTNELNSLYKLYFDFFNIPKVKEAYEINWKYLKNESEKIFEKDFEPIKIYIKKEKKEKSQEKVAAKKSLRGNSIFAFAITLEYDGVNEKIKETNQDKIPETYTIEKAFYFNDQEQNRIINELKNQVDMNYKTRKYLENIKDFYCSKVKLKKPQKIVDISNYKIVDLGRFENTPIIFSYEDKPISKEAINDFRYNLVYKGLKIGIINYKKFKDLA